MSFGVSGSIGASSSHIYSNPKTMEAVRRVNGSAPKLTEGQRFILRLRAQKAEQALGPRKLWHDEFLHDIYRLREAHLIAKSNDMEAKRKYWEKMHPVILKNFRSITVIKTPKTGRVTVDSIIRDGCVGTCFTPADVRGPRRKRELVELRHRLMAQAYQECKDMSLSQIGKAFGGRDHSSVYFSVKKMGVHISQTGEPRQYIDHRRKAA
jgi:hypothetical protein